MSALLEKVRLDASQLPQEEKQLLAIELIDSAWGGYESQEAVDAAWDSEIAKRVEEVRSGAVELQPWTSVRTSLAKEFGWDK